MIDLNNKTKQEHLLKINSFENKNLKNSPHEFFGRHLMLNFLHCKFDLENHNQLKIDMEYAIKTVGAKIINSIEHKFFPRGITILYLLSESHASIHTYPEFNGCFIDIFTCGRTIEVNPFGEILKNLWAPENLSSNYEERFHL